MKDGEKIRLIGSAGAPFVATVGTPFSAGEIQRRIDSGEWKFPDVVGGPEKAGVEPAGAPESGPADGPQEPVSEADPDRPAQSAPKSEWIVYAARTLHMSREDAANYTKADLIDLTS